MTRHEAISRSRFLTFAFLIVVLALALREQFILLTQVVLPIRGDPSQYFAYAYNITHFGIFSSNAPGSGVLVADAFRGPGYPAFLSVMMLAQPQGDDWYSLTLHTQALLGAGTVALSIALGRLWLSRAAALAAGMLIAVWPHHIAATGAILSELLFGFVLVAALFSTLKAVQAKHRSWAIVAGLMFGYAYLINPLTAFFPPLVAVLVWPRSRQLALCLFLLPTLMATAWTARNMTLPADDAPGRASINFVQGSWPLMHAAWTFSSTVPEAARVMKAIDLEARNFAIAPLHGLSLMGARMAKEPADYARWYLIEKPYLLWDWDIRIGQGDVYVQEQRNSPLDTNPALRRLKTSLHLLNLPIFLLSGTTALLLAWRLRRADQSTLAPFLVALFCVYVTLIHVIFQAEPRYSTPYRPFQMLLLTTAISFIIARVQVAWRVTRDTL